MTASMRRTLAALALLGVVWSPVVPALAAPPHKANPSTTNENSANYVPPAAPGSAVPAAPVPPGPDDVGVTGGAPSPSPAAASEGPPAAPSVDAGVPSPTPLPVIALPSTGAGSTARPVVPASTSPTPMPTFTLPPGFVVTGVQVLEDPERTSAPSSLSGLLAGTGGPWLAVALTGAGVAGLGGWLLRRR